MTIQDPEPTTAGIGKLLADAYREMRTLGVPLDQEGYYPLISTVEMADQLCDEVRRIYGVPIPDWRTNVKVTHKICFLGLGCFVEVFRFFNFKVLVQITTPED